MLFHFLRQRHLGSGAVQIVLRSFDVIIGVPVQVQEPAGQKATDPVGKDHPVLIGIRIRRFHALKHHVVMIDIPMKFYLHTEPPSQKTHLSSQKLPA